MILMAYILLLCFLGFLSAWRNIIQVLRIYQISVWRLIGILKRKCQVIVSSYSTLFLYAFVEMPRIINVSLEHEMKSK